MTEKQKHIDQDVSHLKLKEFTPFQQKMFYVICIICITLVFGYLLYLWLYG